MRRADISTAGILALFSIYLMVLSTELPIGWVPGQGPGGGAFPFWLSAIMLVGSLGILVRAWRGRGLPPGVPERFVDPAVARLLGAVVASLVVLLLAIHVVGVYVAIPAFLVFYLRGIGRHSWRLTAALALATPVFLFFFFEVALKILLPKGVTEPLFYPLYAVFL